MIKKYFKKLVSLALIATMVMGMSITAFADENDTFNLDTELLERGYPQIVLDTMDNDAKMNLYNNDAIFAGATISYYNEEDGTFTDIIVEEDGSYIAPRGQISTADLSLSFTYSIVKNSGKLNYIEVTYSYNWTILPVFRWQDPVSVSWDNSKFEMTDDSFSKVDKYDGYVTGASGIPIGPHIGLVHSSENGYASASAAGVTWYADLKGYTGIEPTKLYGYGTFRLKPISSTSSGSTTLYGHYVHPTIAISLSVSVSSYGNFSVSVGSGFDECGSQKTISW